MAAGRRLLLPSREACRLLARSLTARSTRSLSTAVGNFLVPSAAVDTPRRLEFAKFSRRRRPRDLSHPSPRSFVSIDSDSRARDDTEDVVGRRARVAALAARRSELRAAVADAAVGGGSVSINDSSGSTDSSTGSTPAEVYTSSTSQSGRFVDALRLEVHAGRGGSGVASFLGKLRIPGGGNGGQGGDVVVRASDQTRSLSAIRQLQRAQRGGHGGANNKTGAPGERRVITVPVGTVVRRAPLVPPCEEETADGEESYEWMANPGQPWVGARDYGSADEEEGDDDRGDSVVERLEEFEVLADLTRDGEEVTVARGGRGGIGNTLDIRPLRKAGRVAREEIALRNQRRRQGHPGEAARVQLELKSVADVGFVGVPNAGKSTLLAALSAAKPAVGAYPFTTLRPQLGVLPHSDGSFTVLADIPGLIRGAHLNRGLGHEFLRHIERTRVLVYVIDITAVPVRRAGYTEILSARQQLAMLKSELSAYDPALLDKPSVVAANKVDAMGDRGAAELVAIRRAAAPWPVVAISGLRRTGIDELAAVLRAHVSSH